MHFPVHNNAILEWCKCHGKFFMETKELIEKELNLSLICCSFRALYDQLSSGFPIESVHSGGK